MALQTPTGVPGSTRIPTRTTLPNAAAYEWFLELPAPVVMATLWLLGVALVGSCALGFYDLVWLLLGASAGP